MKVILRLDTRRLESQRNKISIFQKKITKDLKNSSLPNLETIKLKIDWLGQRGIVLHGHIDPLAFNAYQEISVKLVLLFDLKGIGFLDHGTISDCDSLSQLTRSAIKTMVLKIWAQKCAPNALIRLMSKTSLEV